MYEREEYAPPGLTGKEVSAFIVFLVVSMAAFFLIVAVVTALGPYPGWMIEDQDASVLLGILIGIFAAPMIGIVSAVLYHFYNADARHDRRMMAP